ncbi:MAG: IS200/IS605 family transposase [Elusimicrobiota bacterium]|nr:IS200/IS605 family transposase [Elusimicrobiota bacterium]
MSAEYLAIHGGGEGRPKICYNIGMALKRTRHAVYELKYHIVWIPKYCREILTEEMGRKLKEIFYEIAQQYEFDIDELEVMREYTHVFVSALPRYSPSTVVNLLKGTSSWRMFQEFPHLKQYLWGGELWNDGYFLRSTGDKVTTDMIREYIQYQKTKETEVQFRQGTLPLRCKKCLALQGRDNLLFPFNCIIIIGN